MSGSDKCCFHPRGTRKLTHCRVPKSSIHFYFKYIKPCPLSSPTSLLLSKPDRPSNYTALVGVWIYGFFVMVLLALDFLYYSAINYELCRVYLEKWGLGGRWLKKARSQWNRSLVEESEAQAQAQPMVPSHYQPRHSLRGESHSPTLLPYNTSTAW